MKKDIAGTDVCILNGTDRFVDIQGIANHQVTDIELVMAVGVITMQKREIVCIASICICSQL